MIAQLKFRQAPISVIKVKLGYIIVRSKA